MYPVAFYEFIVLFNEGDYYTCHDLLEEMWLEDRQDLFLKGLLQFSVGLYHYSYGNIKGARSMLYVGKQYLSQYPNVHHGLHVKEICTYIDCCLERIPADIERVSYDNVSQLPKLLPFILKFEEEIQ